MDAEKEMQEYEEKQMKRWQIIVRRIFSYTAKVIIFGIIALVLWRVFFSDIVPSDAERLIVNEANYAAYLAGGETLTMYTQEQERLSMDERIEIVDDRETTVTLGMFWVCQTVVIPDAQQVQLLTRYNNSTLRQIATDYKLKEIPSRDEEIVVVSLVVLSDPTPADPDNNDEQKTRYYATGEPYRDNSILYNYRKFVFDGLVIDETTLSVTADFYYVGRSASEGQPDSRMVIYTADAPTQPVKLTSADKRALKEYGENNK